MKTLIVSTLLLLVVGSVAAVNAAPHLSKDGVIAQVEKLGGKVDLDEALPTKPIVKIDLHATRVTDAELIFLANSRDALRQLRYLDLRLTHIGDAGAGNLSGLT